MESEFGTTIPRYTLTFRLSRSLVAIPFINASDYAFSNQYSHSSVLIDLGINFEYLGALCRYYP